MLDQLTKPARIICNPATWPDAHFEFLKECWAAGMSSGIAQAKINEKFRTSYSRNAIIGKVNRHALSVVYNRVKAAPMLSSPHSRGRRHIAKRMKVSRLEVARFKAFPLPVTAPMPVEPLNILFGDLKKKHCREIVGNDGWHSLSCGHPKLDTSSYCAWHHAINTWIPPSRSRPYFPMGGR